MNLDARTRARVLCERARVARECSRELAATSAEWRVVAHDHQAAAQQARLLRGPMRDATAEGRRVNWA